ACLVLLQYADDLFVCETIALHPLVLSMGQSLLQNGLFQRGKVILHERAPRNFQRIAVASIVSPVIDEGRF
ncbi:hypothetical protein, partial [Rhizobium leguminosarum]|uniref:hypothetical protein n=1 Tax=Rhizobium leguminosarum TaxID=384 RepID=UPI001C97A8D7